VNVIVATNYPFSDVIRTSISSTKGFTYYVRIPSWVKKGSLSIVADGGSSIRLSHLAPEEETGLQAIEVGKDLTEVVLELEMDSEIVIGECIPSGVLF
jgi:DUF1680 family protein